MANHLIPSLLHQPSGSLNSNNDNYHGSISCTRFFLNALAKAEDLNHNIHTNGFDVDQIWMQSQVLLGAIQVSAYLSRISECDADQALPKKRAKRNKTFQPGESVGPDHNVVADDDRELIGSRVDPVPESSSSESGADSTTLLSRNGTGYAGSRDRVRGRAQDELDDGFFSLDTFNLETEGFEQADELGKSLGSLDTAINWHVDPDDDDQSSIPASGSPEDLDDNLMYEDFFLPPEHPGRQIDKAGGAPFRLMEEADPIDGIEEMMNEMEQDLFDGESSDRQITSLGSLDDRDPSSHRNAQSRLSGHIRELESENVGKREWTLSGETNSKQRPFNSLLQEDLDFERIGKPVPVVTQESTTTLEGMIKGRIIAGNFDEVLRRSLVHHNRSQRSAVELDDSKSRVGLAEAYEQEHLDKATPTQLKGADVKLDALRSEISGLLSTVTNQLDMLSSWHFTPKAPQSTLSVVQDVRTLNIEEVQVNANHLSMPMSAVLAPQEVYNPSSKEHQGDGVVKVSGIPMSHSEVERSRRTKEKGRKSREVSGKSGAGSRADENARILKTLRGADVAVIGQDGKHVSLGNSRLDKTSSSGSRIKL
ncbi:U3 snoRNP protein [Arthrobotrys musiformis]|uniref:U3 snoRNP protein n=1 Tax=Arthrobotrys musiformis TaxID=47236 RepID=A0AAV9WK81_9PEZI